MNSALRPGLACGGAAEQGDEADEALVNFGASQLIPGVRRTIVGRDEVWPREWRHGK